MPDRTLYADLKPVAGPRRTPRPAPASTRPRQHTPIGASRDPAAHARAISRLTYAGGRSSKKPVRFNASL